MKLLGATAATAAVGFGSGTARADAKTIKLGTLAPASSPWGQVFKVWQEAVSKKSDGKLELQFFYNSQQGDEASMVGKIKSGQLDGAAVTAVGLGKVYKPILALQLPGLFKDWAKLDAARDAMKADFEKGAKDAGVAILGWGDVGAVHTMSKGFAIKTPDDVKGKKPYVWRDDDIGPKIYATIGGVTTVPLNVPEVLPGLNTGSINLIAAPALAAEQLQWSSKLDTISDNITAFGIGALIVAQKTLDGLSDAEKTIITDTGKVAAAALTKRIRTEDDAAFTRLKAKMTVTTLSADELAKWTELFKNVRKALTPSPFSAELVTKLEGLAK